MATRLKEIKVQPAEITADGITEIFMRYCLERNKRPESVFLFAQHLGITEKEFYNHFASIEAIERGVFVNFHNHTLRLISQSDEMAVAGFKDNLLAYYYTYFELLTANRSYVVFALKEDKNRLNGILKLKQLRTVFKTYISEESQGYLKAKSDRIRKVQQDALEEGAWIQFLVTLKFWIDDESLGFEKTDLFIEKSIRATFDLIDTTPLESVIDFGKFLIKEKLK